MKKLVVLIVIVVSCMAFVGIAKFPLRDQPEFIAPSKQRSGNAAKGYDYLVTGDYLKSGIPFSLFGMGTRKDSNNYLNRTGNNKYLSYD